MSVQPIRGENPEPLGGWPWHLTDYEIEYICAYNSRPVRTGWPADEKTERRLDDEAAGVRLTRPKKARRALHRAWLTMPAALLAGAIALGILAILNIASANELELQRTSIMKEIGDD